MANTKSKVTKKTTTKTTKKTSDSLIEANEVSADTQKKAVVRTRVELDPNSIVTVRNGYQGMLVYISKKTGERFVWDSFGDEQDFELSELKSAKNSYKQFFINNWFLIDDPDVIEYLGVEKYYDNALSFEEFDSLFEMTPDEIEAKISKLSKGQKRSVAFRARKLITDEEIDSRSVIATLEKCLSVELVDR